MDHIASLFLDLSAGANYLHHSRSFLNITEIIPVPSGLRACTIGIA